MGRSRRPHLPGVTVEERRGARATRYLGRYTTAAGDRPSVGTYGTWEEAFEVAAAAQRKVDRGRDPRADRMTFNELIDDHWLPTVQVTSKNTIKNYRSHLGDGSGKPARKGGKAARAARFQLRTVFGTLPIADIGPQHVRVWQAGMRDAGYLHGSILAKRSLLRGIFRLAVVNGWKDISPVDAVPEPPKVQTTDEDQAITPEAS